MMANEMNCPKCGEQQPQRNLCRACAIDMPRFIAARQAEEEAARASRLAKPAARQSASGKPPEIASHDPMACDLTLMQPPSLADARVSGMEVLAVALLAILIGVFIVASGWVPLLDSANLALHEAGHPLVGLIIRSLEVYGGTIFQLLFPMAVVFHFVRHAHVTGVAIGALWLGESLHNVARYMADARIQALPLVGGGNHDWTEIFSRWGVLHLDTRIANLTHALGWLLMIGAVAGLFLRYRGGTSR